MQNLNEKLQNLSPSSILITTDKLGSSAFKDRYSLKYPYIAGAMVRGINSEEMCIKLAKQGMLSFFGTGACSLDRIEDAITKIKTDLSNNEIFGMNLLCNLNNPEFEDQTIDLYLKHNIQVIEAAAYAQVTPSLVRYKIKGLIKENGNILSTNRIIAKISRPEVAAQFLSPAPEKILKKLLDNGAITEEEAELARQVPMADDITTESNSGGHTDNAVAYALVPTIIRMRNDAMLKYSGLEYIHVGAGGGIGTPEAIAASFIMGADYIVTGSINQCTVESGISELVKDMLSQVNIQDTDFAPAGDMFEMGAKVQVLKKGVFFPARANKLYDLYKFCNSIDDIDEKTKAQIETKYFKKSFDEVFQETKTYLQKISPREIEKAENNPKHKMALIFRWYFGLATRLSYEGDPSRKVDYQVHCGPSLGAFNQLVKGSTLEDWHNRFVDDIAIKLMHAATNVLNIKLLQLQGVQIPEDLTKIGLS